VRVSEYEDECEGETSRVPLECVVLCVCVCVVFVVVSKCVRVNACMRTCMCMFYECECVCVRVRAYGCIWPSGEPFRSACIVN
jgi:hypothetical protein